VRVTLLAGWLPEQVSAAALRIADASPELTEIVGLHADTHDASLAGILLGLAHDGVRHALLVAEPDDHLPHLRHVVHDSVEIAKERRGADLTPLVVNACAVVVDLEVFGRELNDPTDVADHLHRPEDDRSVPEVLIDQIEHADVVLVERGESVDEHELSRFHALALALNPGVSVQTCAVCALDPSGLLHHREPAARLAHRTPGWLQLIDGTGQIPAADRGITTVVWRDRRPLAPGPFVAAIEAIPGLIRARGFFWWASRPDLIGMLSVAGGACVIECTGWWWAATPMGEWPADLHEHAVIRSDWDPVVGDRINEIVLIGVELDEAEIRAALSACVLGDVPAALAGRIEIDDPYEAWDDGTHHGIRLPPEWGPPYPILCN
jgi:G3E family GTPase